MTDPKKTSALPAGCAAGAAERRWSLPRVPATWLISSLSTFPIARSGKPYSVGAGTNGSKHTAIPCAWWQ